MSTALLFPFMVLAAVGLLLSICAHVASLAGIALPGGQLVWGLHAGIFVVWLPTVLVANRITRGARRKDFWKLAVAGCPRWMRWALVGLLVYAILNFLFFMASTIGHPQPRGAPTPAVVRGFSGHWMVFYAAAFATLYSAIRSPGLLRERRCPNGHGVAHADRFCPVCGCALTPAE